MLSNLKKINISLFQFKIVYNASKMANFSSKPNHGPTINLWEYGQGITPKKLKIITWNVNGIRSVIKKGDLTRYLYESNPDILCINQTKMDLKAFQKQQKQIAEEFNKQIENVKGKTHRVQPLKDKKITKFGQWYYYFNFCKVSAGYSGVATLTKHLPLRAEQDIQLDHHLQLEGRSITLEYKDFYLVNCYKPNSGSQLQRLQERTQIYDPNFSSYIKSLQRSKHVIVCGDMNVAHKEIDLAKPKQNTKSPGFTKQERKAFDDFLKQTNLIDSYRYLHPEKIQYTWWSTRARARQKNVGWRIDHVLVSNQKLIKQCSIKGQVMGSDHCPVECIVQF